MTEFWRLTVAGHQHPVDHRLDRPEPVNLAHAGLPQSDRKRQHGISSKTRHLYIAETRHLNLGLTSIPLIIYIMSNNTELLCV